MSDKLSLSNTQKWMQQILVSPLSFDTDPSSFLPEDLKDDLEKIIAPNSRLGGKQRLEIYQTSYLARLRDCMEKQFTALKYALGNDLFQAFADDYLQKYPSQSYTLNDLGNRLAQFLQETRPDKDAPLNEKEDWPDFMIELAQYEYAINQTFDASFATDFEYATLKSPDHKLELVDSLQLFSFRFPVNQYYQSVVKNKPVELPLPSPTCTAILRKKNFQIGLIDLNPSQYHFLTFWLASGSFEKAKMNLKELSNDIESQFEKIWPLWKKYWIESGFLKTV